MIAPDGRNLPVATGAASGGEYGGSRPERITDDQGVTRSAAPTGSEPEPMQAVTEPQGDPVVSSTPSGLTETPPASPAEDVPADEEIDQLHARFDRMESLLKRRLGVATLHARFDNLEAWLNARF